MKENKEKELLNILQEKQFIGVEELASLLFVSPATIRRELTKLQNKGLILRTHGGAKINDSNNFTPNFDLRAHTNSLEKRKIAISAIKLIKNGDVIFLDGSTSSYLVAEYLKEFSDIRVMTNGIDTLSLLAKNKVKGYVYFPEKKESNLSFSYIPCKYKKKYINKQGKEIVPCIYDSAKEFNILSTDGSTSVHGFDEAGLVRVVVEGNKLTFTLEIVNPSCKLTLYVLSLPFWRASSTPALQRTEAYLRSRFCFATLRMP